MNYIYGIRVTMENLDGKGGVEDTYDEVSACKTQMEAEARFDALTDHIGQGPGRHTPKYQRVSAVHLIRRPVGEWETVA